LPTNSCAARRQASFRSHAAPGENDSHVAQQFREFFLERCAQAYLALSQNSALLLIFAA